MITERRETERDSWSPMRGEALPTLAISLTYLRLFRGLPSVELARRSGVRPTAISDYERGRIVPELATLYKIVGGLGLPLSALERCEETQQNLVALALLEGNGEAAWPTGLTAAARARRRAHWKRGRLRGEVEALAVDAGRIGMRLARLSLLLLACLDLETESDEEKATMLVRTRETEELLPQVRRKAPHSVGISLAYLRIFRGLSQDELARRSSLTASAISQYEGGKITPGLATLYKLLRGLDLPLSALERCEELKRELESMILPERPRGMSGSAELPAAERATWGSLRRRSELRSEIEALAIDLGRVATRFVRLTLLVLTRLDLRLGGPLENMDDAAEASSPGRWTSY